MGYTHYWSFKTAPKGQAAKVEANYQLALRQCQRFLRAYNAKIKQIDAKHPDRLSGFSVHTKVQQYGGLQFNGTGCLAHENFALREHYSQNEAFNFCKTARKPYDIAVVACLCILKHYLGDLISIETDGNFADFTAGHLQASRILRIKTLKFALNADSAKIA